ncbi:MAG: hypothetical protein ACOY0T_26380 [Myxococcota bacterium]
MQKETKAPSILVAAAVGGLIVGAQACSRASAPPAESPAVTPTEAKHACSAKSGCGGAGTAAEDKVPAPEKGETDPSASGKPTPAKPAE